MIAVVNQIHPQPLRTVTRPLLQELAGRGRAVVVDLFYVVRAVLVIAVGLIRAVWPVTVSAVVWSATSKRGRWVRVALVVFACFQGFAAYRDASRTAERERLVRAILDFHDNHGRYPTSLEEAGVSHNPRVFKECSYFVESKPVEVFLELSDGFMSTHWEYDFRRRRWESFYD